MTSRETLTAGVMCLTIVYGAYELLGSKAPRSKPSSAQSNPVSELKQFAMDITQKLVSEKLNKEYQHMMVQAGANWSKDPFLHSSAQLKKSLATPTIISKPVSTDRAPDLTYTGFMQIGDTKLAILNGIEYAKGESLDIKNYYVKEIYPTRVVIGKIDGLGTIQMPIVEIDSGIGN